MCTANTEGNTNMSDFLIMPVCLHDDQTLSDIFSTAKEPDASSDKDLLSQDVMTLRRVSIEGLQALQQSQEKSTRILNVSLSVSIFLERFLIFY